MNNKKGTKRALLTSMVSLLICMTMLIGTTFAWFTDEVTSSGNIIQSGTLDVTMEWLDGTLAPEETAEWKDASSGAIFDYTKWEPGYVQVRHVKIANVGTLALKYRLNILATGDVSELADVIDVYYIDPAVQVTGRTQLTDEYKLGTLSEILANLASRDDTTAVGSLNAGESETITLALKMQESAGNDYQDMAIGSEFAIQLVATQHTYEEDSFDDQYDAGLELLEDGDIIAEEDGIQYVISENGEKTLYLVTPEYSEDTVNVPEGVTSIGNFAFYYNSNVKTVNLSSTVKDLGRGFDGSKVETVNLNEGLETISNRAFRNTSALRTVNIPSTVKTIEESAFQSSGITEIVVPESVTSIEKAAFGYCPNLTTITIEGNPVIANYAARGCASLVNVVLLGDNVTFSGTSMAFSNAESGKSDKITITVKNEKVADAVKTANGSCTDYKVVVVE